MKRSLIGQVCAFFLLAILAVTPASMAQTPPPEKVDRLIELLSDPAVKTWLETQAKNSTPVVVPAAEEEGGTFSSWVSRRLDSIRQHVAGLVEAMPTLPKQFERAWIILLLEFEGSGLVKILSLIALFIAAGLGLDWLVRQMTANYRRKMAALPYTTPQGRAKAFAARLLYALIMIGAFVAGSAGMFLVFEWPPLLREIVMSFLFAAIVTRATMMFSRALLIPPHLKLPHSTELRAIPTTDDRAGHWYRWVAINVAWFTFAGATFGLLKTFGFSLAGRELIAIPASFILFLLVMAAVWLRPRMGSKEEEKSGWLGHNAASWNLTALFAVSWLLWVSGARLTFWLVIAIAALLAAIVMAHRSVNYLLRPPEGESGGAPVAPVLVAMIDRGLRIVFIVAAAFLLARAWGLDISSVTQGDTMAIRLFRGVINAAVIILAADFGWTVVKAVIARKLSEGVNATAQGREQHQARMRTLLPIIQNILFAAILIMAALMVLSSLGIEIGPLIAGAGVAGVAIGFGAQTLVKDVISGMFYLLDDAFRVGEYIESGSYKGTVENFSLRSIKLRHHRGYLFTVPFGLLGAVQNMSRDYVIDKFNITVGFDTDMEKARKLIKKVGLGLAADPEFAPHVIEPVKMQGVQGFGDYGIQIRVKMTTKPGEQFPMKRKAYILIKKAFEENGITLPIPTVQVKGGETAAAAANAILTAPPEPAG